MSRTPRRVALVGALVLAATLLGCPAPDRAGRAPSPPTATAPSVTVTGPTHGGSPCDELRSAVVSVGGDRVAEYGLSFDAGHVYVAYAAAVDDSVDPTIAVLDAAGNIVAENDDFVNQRFCAVAVIPAQGFSATVRVAAIGEGRGNVALRIQRAGWLAPGDTVAGLMQDFHGFYFYGFEAKESGIYELRTSGLEAGADTLLTVYDPQQLRKLAENDDVGTDDRSSEVLWRCHRPGTYLACVTAAVTEGGGAYQLTLSRLVTQEAAERREAQP